MRGERSYREIEERYGVASSTLQRWVKAAGVEAKRTEKARKMGLEVAVGGEGREAADPGPENLASEVMRLREDLRKAELHNKLLNAMIDIAEEQFEIPIRKKRGARQ